MPDTSVAHQWRPKVFSEYEVGRAVSAIEAVSRADKPVAEVGAAVALHADLECDLKECLALVRGCEDVRFWIKEDGGELRYGFYREAWVMDALAFLDAAELAEKDRTWINGLLFGYRPAAIQDFMKRKGLTTES